MEVIYISTFKAIKATTPYGVVDELLELNVNDASVYRLSNVIKIAGTYTFSIWCKTNKNTNITLNVLGEETPISSNTNWQKIVKTVTVDAVSESNNYIEIDLERGIIGYFYEAYLAEGKSDTSWSPAPEDIDNNMYQIKSEFNQKADEISGKVSDIDGNVSNVTQRVDNITQRVQTAEGDISALEITAGQIKTDVSNVKGDISTLKQTAEGLQTDVSNAKGDISELKQTASGLSTQVESIKGDISRIDQKADKIVIEVGNKIDSEIDKTITSVATEYYVSASPTTMSGGTWSVTAPTWSAGKYVWIRNKFTKDSGAVSYSNPTCLTGAPGSTGATGKGVKTVTNYYLASASGSGVTTSTSGWTTTIQTISASKRYLWNYEKTTYTDNSVISTTPVIIGVHGENGTNGTNGVGISAITEYYQVSASNTTAPTSWVTTPPAMTVTNKYLWNYEKITYTDNTSKETAKRVIGAYGNTGATGTGVKSSAVTYQASASGTTVPTGTWSTTIPTVAAGQYLWTRTVITYTDNKTTTSYSVGRMGQNGSAGANGVGIKSTAITYQAGVSQTTAPTGTWTTSVPKLSAATPYLWTRTIITYTDNKTSTSYSVSSTLDGIEVGGRNYLRNGDFSKIRVHPTAVTDKHEVTYPVLWSNYNNGITNPTKSWHAHVDTDTFDFNVVEFNESDGSKNWKAISTTILDGLTIGKFDKGPFRLSVNVYATGKGTQLFGGFFYWKKGGSGTSFASGQYYLKPTTINEWHRLSVNVPFDCSNVDWDKSRDLRFYIYGYGFETNSILYIKDISLNVATVTTDWTPAPEDVDQGIKDAQDTADKAENDANSAYEQATKVSASLEILRDSISTMVTDENGQSMMTQKGDGWTFNMGSFKTALNQATKDITGVRGDISEVEALANKTNQLANDIAQKTAYINMSTDEDNNPCMELGKTDSPFKLRITNTSIDFMQGTQKIAYVSNQQLYIKSSVVTDEMQIGTDKKGFVWKMRANGNMGLRWKG